jgi:hypothetical protein
MLPLTTRREKLLNRKNRIWYKSVSLCVLKWTDLFLYIWCNFTGKDRLNILMQTESSSESSSNVKWPKLRQCMFEKSLSLIIIKITRFQKSQCVRKYRYTHMLCWYRNWKELYSFLYKTLHKLSGCLGFL